MKTHIIDPSKPNLTRCGLVRGTTIPAVHYSEMEDGVEDPPCLNCWKRVEGDLASPKENKHRDPDMGFSRINDLIWRIINKQVNMIQILGKHMTIHDKFGPDEFRMMERERQVREEIVRDLNSLECDVSEILSYNGV